MPFCQQRFLRKCRNDLKKKKLKPLYVQWIATHKCNFHCLNCGGGAKVSNTQELDTDKALSLIDTLAMLGCKYLSVAGGEILLRSDIFEILGYAKTKGIHVGFVTNGYLVEEYVNQMQKLKPDSVLVSVDGYKDNHDKIRAMPGSYKKCLDSLEIFKKMKIPIIGTYMIVMEENINDISSVVEDVVSHGSMRHGLQFLIPEGNAKDKRISPWLAKEALKAIVKLKKRFNNIIEASPGFGYLGPLEGIARPYHFFCGCGWNTFTIMANGDIMGCPLFEHPEYSEGNIYRDDLEDMWWNRFNRFRDGIFDDLAQQCRDCKHLDSCRGGCWQFRATGGDFCHLSEAKEVAKIL